jgi:hypothetical protein
MKIGEFEKKDRNALVVILSIYCIQKNGCRVEGGYELWSAHMYGVDNIIPRLTEA